jgi:beta-galactosidase
MKMIQKTHSLVLVLLVATPLAVGCSGSNASSTNPGVGGETGAAGDTSSAGATTSSGGQAETGGSVAPVGGGGAIDTGGAKTGGAGQAGVPSGGTTPVGGTPVLGGTTGAGGVAGKGGATPRGGNTVTGGIPTAGTPAGGATTGGGGVPQITPIGNRVRTIMPLDRGWLFNKGDASGADGTSFADSTWRPVNLPHDWSVEGPFSQTAPMTGRGGYLASGIGWYRIHFSLPTTVTSGQVYVEFDGVMANSTVYINGTALGTHPYGYVSFRYDMTKSFKFGVENVIAVKTDTTTQPASRYYAGAGIYRHARVIVTDPVHIDQWATYVHVPSPTAASATVKVTTTVVNSGSSSASVSVQGNVTDATGTAVPAVAAAAQTIAAGASANFAFDVPVTSPKLWSPETPNMYQLVTTVQSGGKAVDDDVTPFGIRALVYDGATGLNINGKNYKFKGVCLHQDYHALGLGAPARAIQRRIAKLKQIGVNAIRTAHDPPNPDFLDLCDRMGILVMDEFYDAWIAHKYSDVGDDAAFFNKASTDPTGMPAVPGGTSGAPWYQVDVTGVVARDRNHPSVALYSCGNEIRDSSTTRNPILTKMASIIHTLDLDGHVTQALFQPSSAGDVTGPNRTLYDVFGGNYRTNEVEQAMAMSPARAGVLTEMGTETTTWTSVTGNPALTGEFMWTGVDYMGERDGGWPSFGGNGALMDELGGEIRANGLAWAKIWGASVTSSPPTGAAAGKVTLTADHDKILNDQNDISFVKAAVSSDTAITFSISGPGTIVAVDSASMTQETFRGNVRNSSGGLAYALVQATGAGTITVTAKASGLTDGTATITATEGVWVPCSDTCD